MKNLIIGATLILMGSAYVKTPQSIPSNMPTDTRIEYLKGDWKSTGFLTDAQNKQQKIEIFQHIDIKDNEITFSSSGINPSNGYQLKTEKVIFYDANSDAWYVKGVVKNRYTLDNKVYVTEFNTITYSFYDDHKNLMRYTFTKENEDSFIEAEEIWTENGWDKTAWLRTVRVEKLNNYSYTTKSYKSKVYDDESPDRPIH